MARIVLQHIMQSCVACTGVNARNVISHSGLREATRNLRGAGMLLAFTSMRALVYV